ncbi:MAG: nucleotidyltransferase family protein [Chitinophagales bacterium]
MNTGLTEQTLDAIIQALKIAPEVNSAVLFGSRARGDYVYNSDIDLAIYSDRELTSRLYFALDEAAGIFKINIVSMLTLTNSDLRKSIEEQGLEIFRR